MWVKHLICKLVSPFISCSQEYFTFKVIQLFTHGERREGKSTLNISLKHYGEWGLWDVHSHGFLSMAGGQALLLDYTGMAVKQTMMANISALVENSHSQSEHTTKDYQSPISLHFLTVVTVKGCGDSGWALCFMLLCSARKWWFHSQLRQCGQLSTCPVYAVSDLSTI